ncbi:MAG: hypothetical protein ACPG8V_03450 [Alphaproteobacteria bacterium]
MIGKILVLTFILLLVILVFKNINKNNKSSKQNDDIVDLEKDKDGKYKSKSDKETKK